MERGRFEKIKKVDTLQVINFLESVGVPDKTLILNQEDITRDDLDDVRIKLNYSYEEVESLLDTIIDNENVSYRIAVINLYYQFKDELLQG